MSLQAEERSFEWNLEESRGVEGVALNDVEEARGGCLLVLRHNLLVFITDDARKLLSFFSFLRPPPSYAISTFVVSLLSSDSAPSLLLLSSGETRSITFPGPPA
ncbi:unnamed protein product [Lasius platythorax]|uniref:Uncharacterized protein n=1 Tax=Lasius platythorax TaxID=488582 RepID=A0AAV2N8X3_9HYME